MCTIFSLNDELNAFGGNNEDFYDPHTRIWFVPRAGGEIDGVPWVPGSYARNYCGYRDLFAQGGINEKGLFFDFTAQRPRPTPELNGRKIYPGNVFDYMMAECATVEELIAFSREYSIDHSVPEEMRGRGAMFAADARGDAAIFEGDGIVRKQGQFLVDTNFYQTHPPVADQQPCRRYQIANEMLSQAVNDVSVEALRRVLSAVQQKQGAYTVYSQIYDLKKQLIHLYHFGNFEEVQLIDPRAEWAKGQPIIYDIADLFSPNFGHIAYTEAYDYHNGQSVRAKAEEKRIRGEIIDLEPAVLDGFVGRYKNELYEGNNLDVCRQGDRLVAVPRNGLMPLYPVSDRQFRIIDHWGERSVTFELNPDGSTGGLILENGPDWPVSYRKMADWQAGQ